MYEILFVLHFNSGTEFVAIKHDKPATKIKEVEDASEGMYIQWTVFFDKKIVSSGEINPPKEE